MRVICDKCYGECQVTVLAGSPSRPTEWNTGAPSEVEGFCPHAGGSPEFHCPEMDLAIERGLFGQRMLRQRVAG